MPNFQKKAGFGDVTTVTESGTISPEVKQNLRDEFASDVMANSPRIMSLCLHDQENRGSPDLLHNS
jgi:hypothetical protein